VLWSAAVVAAAAPPPDCCLLMVLDVSGAETGTGTFLGTGSEAIWYSCYSFDELVLRPINWSRRPPQRRERRP
jgi:hypothetical protein